jgi:Flp pilus assembly protein TadG
MRRNERGSIAPAMPIIALVLLFLGGLGIDGSRQLNARGEATAYAEEAARAGAGAIQDTDVLQLDEGEVRTRVRTYCASVLSRQEVTRCRLVGVLPASDADGRLLRVRVFVRTSIDTTLLGMFGPHTLTASAYGEAEPYEGIRNPGDLDKLGGGDGG